MGTTAASPEALGSPAGYAIPQGHRLLWPHPSLSRPSAGLFPSSGWSLPYGLVWAGRERFPTFLRLSVPPCHLPYPGVPDGCIWLLLRRPPWPSPSWHRLGSRWPTRSGSCVGGVTRLQSSLYAAARWIARSSPARAFTPELAPPGSPLEDVGYDYAGKQPTPAAGLSPARHAAPWAASQAAKTTNIVARKGYPPSDRVQRGDAREARTGWGHPSPPAPRRPSAGSRPGVGGFRVERDCPSFDRVAQGSAG